MKLFLTTWFLFVFSCLQIGQAHAKIRLITSKNIAQPSPEVLDYWSKHFLDDGEIWKITDKKAFRIAMLGQVSPNTIEQLNNHFVQFSKEVMVQASNLYASDNRGYIFIDKDGFILSLSYKERLVIYTYLLENTHIFYLVGDSIEEFKEDLAHSSSKKDSDWLADNIYKIKDKYFLPISPNVLKRLSEKSKENALMYSVSKKINSISENTGVEAVIVMETEQDVRDIAVQYTKFSGNQGLLKKLLSQFKGNPITISLKNLLPSYIAKKHGTFSKELGPNCINCSINTIDEDKTDQFISADHKLEKWLSSKFNEVDLSKNKIRPSDLIVYRSPGNNGIVHLAVAVSPEGSRETLIFTKNGPSRFSPYLIQTLEQNKNFMNPDNTINVTVFRKSSFSRCSNSL